MHCWQSFIGEMFLSASTSVERCRARMESVRARWSRQRTIQAGREHKLPFLWIQWPRDEVAADGIGMGRHGKVLAWMVVAVVARGAAGGSIGGLQHTWKSIISESKWRSNLRERLWRSYTRSRGACTPQVKMCWWSGATLIR